MGKKERNKIRKKERSKEGKGGQMKRNKGKNEKKERKRQAPHQWPKYHTYHIITDGAEGVCPTHIHGGVVYLVEGLDVVPTIHLRTEDTVSRALGFRYQSAQASE